MAMKKLFMCFSYPETAGSSAGSAGSNLDAERRGDLLRPRFGRAGSNVRRAEVKAPGSGHVRRRAEGGIGVGYRARYPEPAGAVRVLVTSALSLGAAPWRAVIEVVGSDGQRSVGGPRMDDRQPALQA